MAKRGRPPGSGSSSSAAATAEPVSEPTKVTPSAIPEITNKVNNPRYDKTYKVAIRNQPETAKVIKGCCDDSEAIRVYCLAAKIVPNKYHFTVDKLNGNAA